MEDDAARLFRTARSMAILCTFFGPVIAGTTASTYALVALLDVARAEAGPDLPVPAWLDPLIVFSVDSAPLMLGLGALFTAVGGYAWARPRRGLGPLRVAAWIGVAGMLGLAGLWWWVARAHGMGAAWTGGGIGAHLVQAVMIVGAARYLGRPDVRDAMRAAE